MCTSTPPLLEAVVSIPFDSCFCGKCKYEISCGIFQYRSPQFCATAHEEMCNSAPAARYDWYKLKSTGGCAVTDEISLGRPSTEYRPPRALQEVCVL